MFKFKTACLLKKLWNAVDKFDIEVQEEILKLDLKDTEYMEIDDDTNVESQVEDLEISKKRKHKKVSVVIEQMI